MIGKQNILTLLLKGIFLQPLLNMSEPLDSNGTILIFWVREILIYTIKLWRLNLPRAKAFFKCQHQQREAIVIFIVINYVVLDFCRRSSFVLCLGSRQFGACANYDASKINSIVYRPIGSDMSICKSSAKFARVVQLSRQSAD